MLRDDVRTSGSEGATTRSWAEWLGEVGQGVSRVSVNCSANKLERVEQKAAEWQERADEAKFPLGLVPLPLGLGQPLIA